MSAYLPPGTPVRVLRPDLPAHTKGVVAEGRSWEVSWEVWVRHFDCADWGTVGHVRGYQYDEIEETT